MKEIIIIPAANCCRSHKVLAYLTRIQIIGVGCPKCRQMMAEVTAVSPTLAQEKPTVHAIMFWMEGCGHCAWVKENVLPPLSEKYGDQWQLELIELRSAEDFDHLFALGTSIGVPREAIGIPFLLIGDAVLIGSGQIPAELPGLIEQHLVAGGVDWPDYPALADLLPEGTMPPSSPAATPTQSNGFTLAVIVLIGMIIALMFAIGRFMMGLTKPSWPMSSQWDVGRLIPLLAVVGLGVAAYLTYVETQAVTAVCGPVGDCNAVQTSEYAYLFGIPIGVQGVIGYIAILAAWAWGKWQADYRAALALLAMTAFGVLFSIYLTYLEPFVIGAVCAWCLTSSVVMTLLMLVSVETAVPQLTKVRKRI